MVISSEQLMLLPSTFQSDILKPFAGLVRKAEVFEIRELALQCIANIAISHGPYLAATGWAQVFSAITFAAKVTLFFFLLFFYSCL